MSTLLEQVRTYCAGLPNSYEDYPFGPEWQVFRHQLNKRCFAYLYELGGRHRVNLKCEPMMADFWRRAYPEAVTPGYHMNKTYWNTILIDASLPWEELQQMIDLSYEITKPGKRKGAGKNGV